MAATAGFRNFVAEHEGPLLRTAYLLTGDRRTAEELLAAALARTHRRWRWGAAADPVAAVRRAMVRSRSRTPHLHRPEDAVRAGADAPPLPEAVEALRRALADLPPRTRAALVLRLHEGLTEAQAADVLGCPPDLVATLTAEGTAALRARGLVEQPTPASPPGPSPAGPTSGGPAATAPPAPGEADDAIYLRPR